MEESVEIERKANNIEKRLTSPIVPLLVTLAVAGAFIYLTYLLQQRYRGDALPYVMVLVAELYLIIQGFLTFWTILSGRMNPRNFEYHSAQDHLYAVKAGKFAVKILEKRERGFSRNVPMYINSRIISVDVFVPVFGEPVGEVERTVIAARDMYGLHETYILDDGKSDDIKALAARLGVHYIRRSENKYAKAGNINHALTLTHGDYFAILDADFVANPHFLYETIPFFENDKLAFVQTPQYYGNVRNFVSTGANFMQHVFYSLVQSGKNRFNAAFCVGTNVVFRRKAVNDIGGIYNLSKSEDIWSSLFLHEHGYDSIYIPNVLAVGKSPETLKAYSKQQLRWATGSFEIFLHHNPLFSGKLTVEQRLQYFATTSFYFVGFSVLLLTLLPPLQIFFNLSPINILIPFWQWALLYSSFYVTQMMLGFYVQGGLKLETLMLATASFPIYIKAFWNALIGHDMAWHATNAKSGYDSPFNYVRMQMYVFIFLLLTTVVGFVKGFYLHSFSISLLWNVINTLIFGYFMRAAWLEARELRSERRRQKKTVLRIARQESAA